MTENGNRVDYVKGRGLDEAVTDGGAHLERIGKGRWFLDCIRADGSSLAVWIDGYVTLTEERPAPASAMSAGTAETEGLRAQPASAARRETPDPIALMTEAAEELDAYYTAENAGDHPHSVTKLAQAKQANPARAALTALQEQPARDLIARIVEYSDRISLLLSEKADAIARATAAEAALDKIVRGRFDGLEVTHYAAIECRNIARAALEGKES
jgi:hypothetical protein